MEAMKQSSSFDMEETLKQAKSQLKRPKRIASKSASCVVFARSTLQPLAKTRNINALNRAPPPQRCTTVDENSNDVTTVVTSPGRGKWVESNPSKRFHFGAELSQVLQQWMVLDL